MNKNSLLPYDMRLIVMLGTTLLVSETKGVVTALTMTVTAAIIMLIASVIVSLIRNKLDEEVKVLTYVVIVAGLCGIFEMLIAAFIPSAFKELNAYLPVIAASLLVYDAVNTASTNDTATSVKYALNIGLKLIFVGLVCGIIRELLANGSICGINFAFLDNFHISVFNSTAGGFLVVGIVAAMVCRCDEPETDSFLDVVFNTKKEDKE